MAWPLNIIVLRPSNPSQERAVVVSLGLKLFIYVATIEFHEAVQPVYSSMFLISTTCADCRPFNKDEVVRMSQAIP